MAQESSDRLIGLTIDGRYVIESRIARGGMAKVYLATDLRLDRKVAVKVMHDHLVDDTDYAAKFIREAQHTARLAHPNIVSVFDQGHEGDVLYLVMEYLPGITLRELLNDFGTLTVEQALDITTAVLQALAVAHREGILHRDVKPENVMLVNDGRIKVGDFGLARPVSSATETGKSLLGTVAYIAPELLTRGQADLRSDLYSVGVMLYEMLAGKQPFSGDSPMRIAMQHAKTPMPLAALSNPAVSQTVDSVIQRATAKSPQDRPKDARVFLDALRKASVPGATDSAAARAANTGEIDDVNGRSPDDATTIIETALSDSDNSDATVPIATGRPARKGKAGVGNPEIAQPATIRIPRLSPTLKNNRGSGLEEFEGQTQRRRPRLSSLFLAITIALAAGGTAGWWFLSGPGSLANVVDVRGMTVEDATKALTNVSIVVLDPAVEKYDDEVAEGSVIGLDPDISGDVARGTEVHLIVSLGPAPVDLPDFDGLSAEEFSSQLVSLGISVTKTDKQFNDDVPDGLVIAVLSENGKVIPAGTTLHRGDSVVIARSVGTVPDVTGKTVSEATTDLQNAGLTVAVSDSREFSLAVPDGNVSSTSVRTGVVRPGDTVTLVLSKGPEMLLIPNVVGMTIQRASDTLTAAGFAITVITDIAPSSWSTAQVTSTYPNGGLKAPRGSTVKIFGTLTR
jgi:serine/threonine-protein kinase